jgi:hypothetical protein
MMHRYTLIILYRGDLYREDFREITTRIRRDAPDIATIAGSSQNAVPLPAAAWSRRTLVVLFDSRFRLSIKRGKIYGVAAIEKHVQAEMFEKAGLSTPRTAQFNLGQQLNEDCWGPFVVLKPRHVNSKGLGIHLVRTSRVHLLTPEDFSDDHPIRKDGYLVQSFVNTGERPCHYRVLTLFGEALYCRKNSRLEARPELSANDDELFNAQIATNAGAEGGKTTTELIYDREIIAFAKRMHDAIPGIALMGCDILRDPNGKLYALETNSGGNTWAFSSELGKSARAVLGKQAMIDQFGAWDVAARVLAQKTRQEAV